MAQPQHTSTLASLEGAITVLFCLIDDAYALLNPRWHSHESLKKLSDSEVLTFWRCCSSFGARRANAPSCGMPSDSSRTCSPEWRGCTLLLVPSPGEEAQALF
jgi:hypothetical protein